MSEQTLAIRLESKGTKVVVKDFNAIADASEQVNEALHGIKPASSAVASGLDSASMATNSTAIETRKLVTTYHDLDRKLLKSATAEQSFYKKLQTNAKKTTRQTAQDMAKLRRESAEVATAIHHVNQQLAASKAAAGVAGAGYRRAANDADHFASATAVLRAETAMLHKGFVVMGSVIAGFGLERLASDGWANIDAMQGYRAQLNTITRDMYKTNAELERLIGFAAKTPYTLDQSIEGFAKLNHLGLDPSERAMRSYGNTASAMNKSLMQMVEAVADATTFEFERLKEFGIKSSQSADQVKFTFQGVTTTVAKNSKSIEKYLLKIGEVQFAGAMANQMDRLSAKASNLDMQIIRLWDAVGNAGAASTAAATIDDIAAGVDWLRTNVDAAIDTVTFLAQAAIIRLLVPTAAKGALGLYAMGRSALTSTVQVNAMGQVIGRTTLKINAMNAASRLASGGLALLGGPVGVAALAGFALYQYATSADQADESTKKFSRSLAAALGDAKALATQNLTRDIEERKKAIIQLKTEIAAVYDLAKKQAPNSPLTVVEQDDINRAVKQLKVLGVEVGALQIKLDDLNDKNKKNKATNEQVDKGLLDLYNKYQKLVGGLELSGAALELYNAQFKESAELPKDAAEAITRWFAVVDKSQKASKFDTQIKSLEKQNMLLQARLSLGEDEYAVQVALAKVEAQSAGDVERLTQLVKLQTELKDQLTEQNRLKAEADNIANTLDDLTTENELLQVKLQLGEREYQLQSMIAELNVTDEQDIAILRQQLDLQYELNEAIEIRAGLENGDLFSQFADSATQVSDAGNVIIRTFGTVIDQFKQMDRAQSDYYKNHAALEAERARIAANAQLTQTERQAALEQLSAVEVQLADRRTSAELASYGAIAGAASQMFDEQSTARKRLHQLELLFSGIEIALSFTRAQASAIEGVANQAKGDPYSAFARMAAMAGIMASLGLSVGGSGFDSSTTAQDRQDSQGTGTVFGSDDKSNSLANAYADMLDTERQQYAELVKLNNNMSVLASSMQNVVRSLVQDYGRFDDDTYAGDLSTIRSAAPGIFGVIDNLWADVADSILGVVGLDGIFSSIVNSFSKTKRKLTDSGIKFYSQTLEDIINGGMINAQAYFDVQTKKSSWWGLSSSTSNNTEYQAIDTTIRTEFAAIFGNIGDTISESLDILGVNAARDINTWATSISEISFKDLDGEQIEEELQAVLSQQADLMTGYVTPAMMDFQDIGEGLYETLMRVTREQVIFNDVLLLTGQSLAVLSADEQIAVAQSVIDVAGSIDDLSSAAAGFYENFYSEAEQFEFIQQQINEQFAALGVAVPATDDAFRDLIGSFDLTTDQGVMLYNTLLSMQGMMRDYYNTLEDQVEATAAAEAAELALAAAREQLSADYADELARFDMSDLQLAKVRIDDWYADALAQAEEVGADTSFIDALYNKKLMALAESNLQAAIDTAHNDMSRLTATFDSDVAAVTATFDKLVSNIGDFGQSLDNAVLNIRMGLDGFDMSGHHDSQVIDQRNQLYSGIESAAERLDIANQLRDAIIARYEYEYSANQQLINDAESRHSLLLDQQSTLATQFDSSVQQLNDALSTLLDSIDTVSHEIGDSIHNIRAALPGFDSQSYHDSQVTALYGQLNQGDINAQLTVVDKLNKAIVARYNNELSLLDSVATAANEQQQVQDDLYRSQLDHYNALTAAAEDMAKAARALTISDLSPLTLSDQLAAAETQFNTLVAAARGGDVDAYSQVQSVGQKYLQLGRDYNPGEYAALFGSVKGVFDELGNISLDEPTQPPPHPATAQYQQQSNELSQAAIDELQTLQQLTTQLQSMATTDHNAALGDLQAQYALDSAAITSEITASTAAIDLLRYESNQLAQNAIVELQSLQSLTTQLQNQAQFELDNNINDLRIQFAMDSVQVLAALDDAIDTIDAVLPAQTAILVDQMQSQIDAITDMRDAIVSAIVNLPKDMPQPPVTKPPVIEPPVIDVILDIPVITLPDDFDWPQFPPFDIKPDWGQTPPIIPPWMQDKLESLTSAINDADFKVTPPQISVSPIVNVKPQTTVTLPQALTDEIAKLRQETKDTNSRLEQVHSELQSQTNGQTLQLNKLDEIREASVNVKDSIVDMSVTIEGKRIA